jgi:hypothetical protein
LDLALDDPFGLALPPAQDAEVPLVTARVGPALQGTDHTGDFDFLYAEMLLSGNAEESRSDETVRCLLHYSLFVVNIDHPGLRSIVV